MILNPQAALSLGGIEFDLGPNRQRTDSWRIVALARNATLGNPTPVNETIQSLLADGSLVVTKSHDNREAAFDLLIEAGDGIALAEAEAALFAECGRLNELRWTPPDGVGFTTLFTVFTSSLEHQFDDFDELRLVRSYRLSLICAPFGRSETEAVESAALATGGADTQISACDATTGWTASGGTLSFDTTYKAEGTGALKITPGSSAIEPVNGGSSYRLTTDVTFTLGGSSLDLSTTPFVAVKVWTRYSESTTVTCLVDGNAAPLVASRTSSASNGPWTTFYFYSTDTSVASLAFRVVQSATFPASGLNSVVAPSAPDWAPRIDDVRRSGSAPTTPTSGKERTLLIPVQGAARTTGSLSVQHETAGLGEVLVYTNPLLSPGGYTPDLTRWTVSYAAQASSSSYLSGFETTLDATVPWRIEVPAAALPRGGYELLAYMSGAATVSGVVTVTISVIIGGVTVSVQSITSPSTSVGGLAWRSLGWVMLPPNDLPPNSTAIVRFDVKYPDSASTTGRVQELLALKCDDESSLTIVNCGGSGTPTLGTANNRMWIKAASLTQPVPAVTMGTKADETDSYNAGAVVKPMGRHNFVPPYVLAFVANTGGANPAITYRHPKCWPTHAASK